MCGAPPAGAWLATSTSRRLAACRAAASPQRAAMARAKEDLFDNASSRLRFEAYSRLQAAAVAFGESIAIPEFVAIGGQSDGKSSLLEAFLGVSACTGAPARAGGAGGSGARATTAAARRALTQAPPLPAVSLQCPRSGVSASTWRSCAPCAGAAPLVGRRQRGRSPAEAAAAAPRPPRRMGTRRPLIVQMVHDPSALEPRCRLQQEDGDEFGPVIAPESAIADAIRERTESHLRKLGATVSSKPIVMRAE